MLKQIAWNTFKTTGNINTMLELLEVDKTINNMKNINITNDAKDIDLKDKNIEEVKKWEL